MLFGIQPPLRKLTSLNVQFNRTNESQDVFEELKGLLGQPVMVYMNEDK